MKFDPITAEATVCLLHEDGSATLLDSLVAGLVAAIKQHGHYGNLTHHVSAGDWIAVSAALRELLVLPSSHQGLSALAKNFITMLDMHGPADLLPFRGWLLDQVEQQTTNFYRRSLERRIDVISDEIRSMDFVFRKTALRILAEAR